MSRRRQVEPAMVPGAEAGEKFMAILLWVQSSECKCPSCEYFRELGKTILEKHITEEKKDG